MVIVYNPMMRIAVLRGGSIVLSVTKGLVRTPNSTKRSQVTVRIIVLFSLEERKCSGTRVVKTQLCTQNRTCRSDVVREPHGELLYDFSMSLLFTVCVKIIPWIIVPGELRVTTKGTMMRHLTV